MTRAQRGQRRGVGGCGRAEARVGVGSGGGLKQRLALLHGDAEERADRGEAQRTVCGEFC